MKAPGRGIHLVCGALDALLVIRVGPRVLDHALSCLTAPAAPAWSVAIEALRLLFLGSLTASAALLLAGRRRGVLLSQVQLPARFLFLLFGFEPLLFTFEPLLVTTPLFPADVANRHTLLAVIVLLECVRSAILAFAERGRAAAPSAPEWGRVRRRFLLASLGASSAIASPDPSIRSRKMQKLLGLVLIVVGVILLILGFREADSLESSFKEFFTGNMTDKAVWYIVGGAAATVLGLGLTVIGRRRD